MGFNPWTETLCGSEPLLRNDLGLSRNAGRCCVAAIELAQLDTTALHPG